MTTTEIKNKKNLAKCLFELTVGNYIKYNPYSKIRRTYFKKIKKQLEPILLTTFQQNPSYTTIIDDIIQFFHDISIKTYNTLLPIIPPPPTTPTSPTLSWETQSYYYITSNILPIYKPIKYNNLTFLCEFPEPNKTPLNEKRYTYFTIKTINLPYITLKIHYSPNPEETDIKTILETLNNHHITITKSTLLTILKKINRQKIYHLLNHKNLKKDLLEHLQHWSNKHFFINQPITPQTLLNYQTFTNITSTLITLIHEPEDTINNLWKNQITTTEPTYIITLNKINSIDLIKKLLTHENFPQQLEEWKTLNIIPHDFCPQTILTETLIETYLNPTYQSLPIDTKYFKDLEPDLLATFENLETAIDGYAIHSENYLALTHLQKTHKNTIQIVYIDPPYNTQNKDLTYTDTLPTPLWLTMLENRLTLTKSLMTYDGLILTSIGDTNNSKTRSTSQALLNLLLDKIFDNNYIGTFIRKSGSAPKRNTQFFVINHDYIICYAKHIEPITLNKKYTEITYKYTDSHLPTRGRFNLNQLDRGSLRYCNSMDFPITIQQGQLIEIFDGKTIKKQPSPETFTTYPGGDPNDKRWNFRWSKDKVNWGIKNDFIVFKKSKNNTWKVLYKQYERVDNKNQPKTTQYPYSSLILDTTNEIGCYEIKSLFHNKRMFDYAKPVKLLTHLLTITSKKNSTILDFFAGSASTAHATIDLNNTDNGNRKFIIIEMTNHFNTTILPRLKKIAYSLSWKNNTPTTPTKTPLLIQYYQILPPLNPQPHN